MKDKITTESEKAAFQEGYRHGIAHILNKISQQFAADAKKLAVEAERVLSGEPLNNRS